MKKKALEQFEDLKKDIELIARMAQRMNPDVTGEDFRKLVLDEIELEPQIVQDMEAFTAEHLIDIKIKVDEDGKIQLDTIDLSKNKIKLQIRANGGERVINATINDIPVLVKAQKDDKFEFSNSDVIEAVEQFLEILKTDKLPQVSKIDEDVTYTGKEIASFFEEEQEEVSEQVEPEIPEEHTDVESTEEPEEFGDAEEQQ